MEIRVIFVAAEKWSKSRIKEKKGQNDSWKTYRWPPVFPG